MDTELPSLNAAFSADQPASEIKPPAAPGRLAPGLLIALVVLALVAVGLLATGHLTL